MKNGTKINLEYFGMPGSGATVTEAKQDAGRKIESLLQDLGMPLLLHHKGAVAILTRDTYGWGYRLFDVSTLKAYQYAGHCSGGFDSREECLKAAVHHLAQNMRRIGEKDAEIFDALPERDRALARREFAIEAERDDLFQTRYREALARGMENGDAHDYACQNPARRDLWETPQVAATA